MNRPLTLSTIVISTLLSCSDTDRTTYDHTPDEYETTETQPKPDEPKTKSEIELSKPGEKEDKIPVIGEGKDLGTVTYTVPAGKTLKEIVLEDENSEPWFLQQVIRPPPTGEHRISPNAVMINFKHFEGYSPYDIPFVGQVGTNIAKILVNNKVVKFDKPGDLYFRQKISLAGGYNRIPVKIITKNELLTEGYIEITIENTPDQVIEIK